MTLDSGNYAVAAPMSTRIRPFPAGRAGNGVPAWPLSPPDQARPPAEATVRHEKGRVVRGRTPWAAARRAAFAMLDNARYVDQERKSGLRSPARLRRLYRDAHEKSAALLHSLARNRPLVGGKERLALTGRRDDDRPRL